MRRNSRKTSADTLMVLFDAQVLDRLGVGLGTLPAYVTLIVGPIQQGDCKCEAAGHTNCASAGEHQNMKSALFVDFDNVFSQLRQLQPDAAERFARHPSEWIGWLTSSLPLPEPNVEGERRRLLVRRCYLNPNWYQN